MDEHNAYLRLHVDLKSGLFSKTWVDIKGGSEEAIEYIMKCLIDCKQIGHFVLEVYDGEDGVKKWKELGWMNRLGGYVWDEKSKQWVYKHGESIGGE